MADENKTTTDNKDTKDASTESRKSAIERAMNEVEKSPDKESSDDSSESKETKEEASSKDTKETKETKSKDASKKDALDEEASDEDIEEMENAIRLFRGLNDPKQAEAIVRAMAEKAGLLDSGKSSKEVKKEVASFEDDIDAVIKEEFGDEYKFLADKISKILKKVVPAVTDARTKEIKDDLKARDERKLQTELSTALNDVFGQYEKIPRAVEMRFKDLMEEMPPNPKTNPKVYFNRLIKIAAEETESKLVPVKSAEKSKDNSTSQKDKNERNKRDATSHLASESTSSVDTEDTKVPDFKNKRDAIRAAMEKVQAEMRN
jgi:hypothetical protein